MTNALEALKIPSLRSDDTEQLYIPISPEQIYTLHSAIATSEVSGKAALITKMTTMIGDRKTVEILNSADSIEQRLG